MRLRSSLSLRPLRWPSSSIPRKEARTWLRNSFTAFNVIRSIRRTKSCLTRSTTCPKRLLRRALAAVGPATYTSLSTFSSGDSNYKVVSALLPDKLESWLGEEAEEVTFYPFLVVLETTEGKQFCWMPYWHVTGKEARYGQHAIRLEKRQFDSLWQQVGDKELEPV